MHVCIGLEEYPVVVLVKCDDHVSRFIRVYLLHLNTVNKARFPAGTNLTVKHGVFITVMCERNDVVGILGFINGSLEGIPVNLLPHGVLNVFAYLCDKTFLLGLCVYPVSQNRKELIPLRSAVVIIYVHVHLIGTGISKALHGSSHLLM